MLGIFHNASSLHKLMQHLSQPHHIKPLCQHCQPDHLQPGFDLLFLPCSRQAAVLMHLHRCYPCPALECVCKISYIAYQTARAVTEVQDEDVHILPLCSEHHMAPCWHFLEQQLRGCQWLVSMKLVTASRVVMAPLSMCSDLGFCFRAVRPPQGQRLHDRQHSVRG